MLTNLQNMCMFCKAIKQYSYQNINAYKKGIGG